MRLAEANRRKAPISNGVLIILDDSAAVFMIPLGSAQRAL
jgi:hypothetical protein